MKNANLIATLVGAVLDTMSTDELKNRLVSLIQAHPEEVRENALAILSGNAELTVRPIEQVQIVCGSDKYSNIAFKELLSTDFLASTVRCSIFYTRKDSHWYKSEDDAAAKHDSRSYKGDAHTIEQVENRDDTDVAEFSLSEWNTGCVKWR